MDWFDGPRTDYYCYVTRSGQANSARNVINWAIQGGNHVQLNQTNLDLLIATINVLPPPPKVQPPQERWLVVRGIRTNQWFKYIYDRANVPSEIETLYKLAGGYLEWFIPNVDSQQFSTQASAFLVAKNAPIGVSLNANEIKIWDLSRGQVQDTFPASTIPHRQAFGPYQDVQAISPDGNIIVVACENGICAVDLTKKNILWNRDADALEHEGRYNKNLAIGGDKGQFLFAAGAHTLERWDLMTGKKLGTLATEQPAIKTLEISINGKVLLAGFDDSTFDSSKSFTVWRVNDDKPAAHIEESQLTASCISSDGHTIALDVFGNKNLELWNWENNSITKIPLRLPYGSVCAIRMFWSPDGNRLAAYLQGASYSMVFYETKSWKPLGHWMCDKSLGSIAFDLFSFDTAGKFYELRRDNIDCVDVGALKGLIN